MRVALALEQLTPCDWTAIAGLVLAWLTFVAGQRARAPNLVVSGSGGCGSGAANRQISRTGLQIRNSPRWWFGQRLLREAAHIVFAQVYDPALRLYVGRPLVWGLENSPETLSQERVIECGKDAMVCVFAKDIGTDRYYVFQPEVLKSPPAPSVEDYKVRMKEFELHLTDSIQRRYRFKFTANHSDNSIDVARKPTVMARIRYWGKRVFRDRI